jgi:hypothetical protein
MVVVDVTANPIFLRPIMRHIKRSEQIRFSRALLIFYCTAGVLLPPESQGDGRNSTVHTLALRPCQMKLSRCASGTACE